MEISAKYSPQNTEDKWYSYWLKNRYFHSEPDGREPYTIVIPPPNVTGVLHMGHMLNNTIQDVLVRRARMKGKNACWVPGTDHASIATEAKVVAKLKAEGIEKSQLTREEFMKHAWEWKEKHGGIILEQLKKLGASCDWERTRFTMEPELSKAVIRTFVYFYKKGLIYRGVRMVNWDPVGLTAVSDEEVVHKETKSKLYYLRYYVAEEGKMSNKYIVVATTRPETIMADAAVCINPNDSRYHWLKGKKVFIPAVHREIPIIEDEYVTMDFGTGCLKVTPAHDVNDYALGIKHNLPVLDIIDDHGCIKENATILVGQERFQARENIVKMLQEAGEMEKIEDYISPVGHSERTNAVIEPKLSMQWFLKMDALAQTALESVESGRIKLIPDKYRNTYRHWMEEVKDWCISRQLWWGQQIPAYYLPSGEYVVAESREEALEQARKINPDIKAEELTQDPDVLDTWFSSWLWPISVFDPQKPGRPEAAPNADLAYYYPTNDLVTGPDIIFFWVARMVMAGDEFMGKEPFGNVYFTGIVRDKLGRKMSKTLGNSPDPLKLIEDYGADAVRLGMLLCSSAGNDILFDISQVEQGRNFANKIWNAYRLVKGWEAESSKEQPEHSRLAVEWFANKLNKTIEQMDDHCSKFRLSDSLMCIYKFFWDDFCAWYLEIVKPAYGEKMDMQTYKATLGFFDALLKMLHPYMPFITEELWHALEERKEGETIMLQALPEAKPWSLKVEEAFDTAASAIMNIRSIRQSKGISPKEPLQLLAKAPFEPLMAPVIRKMANVSKVEVVEAFDSAEEGANFLVGTNEFFVPLNGLIDQKEERAKIEAEIAHLTKFLAGVNAKLSNQKFVNNAPAAVVAVEKKKQSDATLKLESLNERLKRLN